MTAQFAQPASLVSGSIFEAMNTKNMAVLEPYLAEDVMFDFPGTDTGCR